MFPIKDVLEILNTATRFALTNDDFQKMMLGTYSDGKTRSFADAISGEIMSPKEKAKMEKRIVKNKKKKKKRKKKGKKYGKIDLKELVSDNSNNNWR